MGIALFSHMTRNVLQLHITCTIYKWNRMCGEHSHGLTIDVWNLRDEFESIAGLALFGVIPNLIESLFMAELRFCSSLWSNEIGNGQIHSHLAGQLLVQGRHRCGESVTISSTCGELPLSVQFRLVAQSCPTLWPRELTPGLPVHHHLPESTQTHVHWVSDAIHLV